MEKSGSRCSAFQCRGSSISTSIKGMEASLVVSYDKCMRRWEKEDATTNRPCVISRHFESQAPVTQSMREKTASRFSSSPSGLQAKMPETMYRLFLFSPVSVPDPRQRSAHLRRHTCTQSVVLHSVFFFCVHFRCSASGLVQASVAPETCTTPGRCSCGMDATLGSRFKRVRVKRSRHERRQVLLVKGTIIVQFPPLEELSCGMKPREE